MATAVVLGIMALGVTGLKASGLSNADSFRGTPDSVAGGQVVARHFPAGAGQPVVVIGSQAAGPQLSAALREVPGITGVTQPREVAGHAYLEGTLTAPADSGAASDTINAARNAVHAVPGADAMVGGNTAINLDVQNAAAHDRNVIIPLVLAVVLVILAVLLRALVAPLILPTVVLSFAATLGVSALVFNHLFGFDGADTSFPLFVFVFLVALGIDYNIFLMTRVREEAARSGPRRGALTGLAVTGGVITSEGAVLAARSPCSARCRSQRWPSSGSRSRSACCWTPSSSGRCWSPHSTWTLAGGCGGARARGGRRPGQVIDRSITALRENASRVVPDHSAQFDGRPKLIQALAAELAELVQHR